MRDQSVMRLGSTGPFVRDLQLALNARLLPSPNLVVNGAFGEETAAALRAFQKSNWLVADGICDEATQDCLYGTEAGPPIQHNLRHRPLTGPQGAFVALTAMLLGVDPVSVRAPLAPGAEDPAGPGPARGYCLANGLTYHPPRTWSPLMLVEFLQRGPIGLECAPEKGGARRGGEFSGPALIVAAARGSHGPDGTTTTFRIYDPGDAGPGAIRSVLYASLMRRMGPNGIGVITRG